MRTSTRHRFVVALAEDKNYARLTIALQGHASLERAPDWNRLLYWLRRKSSATVVLDLATTLPHTAAFATRALAASPNVGRLVLICTNDAAGIELAYRLPPCADELISPAAHDDIAIRKRVLADLRIENAVHSVFRLLETRASTVAAAVGPYVSWCLDNIKAGVDRRLTVDDMAHHADRSRAMLDRTFMRAVGSTPRQLIALVYALVAVALLEQRWRSAAYLAETLKFSSASSLCQSVARTTGRTFGQIREKGGTSYLVDILLERFGNRRGPSALTLGPFAQVFEGDTAIDDAPPNSTASEVRAEA